MATRSEIPELPAPGRPAPRAGCHETRARLDVGVFGARGIPSTYGGFETFLTALLPELARRGHAVTTYCRRGEVPHLASYRGVRCVQIPAMHSQRLSTPAHGWVAAARSWPARHDVLLVMNVANAPACLAARITGRRIVLNTDGLEWNRGKWSRLGRGVFLLSAHLARWAANALIADSNAMRDVYLERFGAPSTVIPYCWTEIDPAPPSALARWDLEPRQYLLIAARLVPENNVDTVAEAYLGTDAHLPLVVLGTSHRPSRVVDRLTDLARRHPRLVLAGHLDDRSLFGCLVANARAYIHGHSAGGINPSLLEAMGCGARVLALDTLFNREALDDTGDYFPHPREVVEPLRRIAAEPRELSDRKREAARQRACARFALEAVADAYEDLLYETSSRPSWAGCTLVTPWDASARVSNILG